jgi:hypothetical protein
MHSVAKLYELFVMKNYMQVQSDVLQNLARHFGYSEIRNINSFLSSTEGQFAMKMFRKILIDKYGEDPSKPNSPNTDNDPGFLGSDPQAKENLVRKITSDIIIMYNKEHGNG